MNAGPQRDVACPRCAYNLRGLTSPRCPECGLPFDLAEAATGYVRENVATRLDRADLWQPHQVIVCSLYELVRGVLRPRRYLRTVDVNGPLAPAWLMLGCGLVCVWLVVAGLVAAGVVVHTGASPAAAVRTAMFVWGPAMLATTSTAALAAMALVASPAVMGVAKPNMRQRLRFALYLLPVLSAYGSVPWAATLCLLPEMASSLQTLWDALPVLIALLAGGRLGVWHGLPISRIVVRLAWLLGFGAAAWGLAAWLAPGTLEPPWRVYFW